MDNLVITKSKIQEHLEQNPSRAFDMYVDALYTFSNAICEYREKNELTQKQLATLFGMSQAMVSKLESGEYNFTIKELCHILSKMGYTLHMVEQEECIKICLNFIARDIQYEVVQSSASVFTKQQAGYSWSKRGINLPLSDESIPDKIPVGA